MELRVALVTPLAGPLGGYGRAGADALALWAETASGLPAPWRVVDFSVHDAHPDPAAAMARAVADRPDVVFGPYGSSPALAAIGATDRLVWNHGGATSKLRRPRYPNSVNVPASAATYFDGALRAVRAANIGASTVVLLRGATGFAADVGRGAQAAAAACGLSVVERVFEPGRAAEVAKDAPASDVLLVVGGFDDEIAIAGVVLGRPWRAVAFVGAGVEEVLASLGDAREGLLGPAQWLASAAPHPDVGPDAAWFANAFRQATGGEPSYPAAQAFTAGVLCGLCLEEAGEPDDESLLAAAGRLDVTTLYGRFRLDPDTGLQVGHEVLTVQWQQGVRRVIWPPDRAERALVHPFSWLRGGDSNSRPSA